MESLPGVSLGDTQRTRQTLQGFNAYAPSGWYLVGGLVERYYLHVLGGQVPVRPYNGIDLAIPGGIDALSPEFLGRYAVFHLHQGHTAMVDRISGVKLNVFTPRHSTRPDVQELASGFIAPIQRLAEQMASLLDDLLKLSHDPPETVDIKQFEYMDALTVAIGSRGSSWQGSLGFDIEAAWQRRHPSWSGFSEMRALAYDLQYQLPQHVRHGVYTGLGRRLQEALTRCPACTPREDIPLTPMWKAAFFMLSGRRLP